MLQRDPELRMLSRAGAFGGQGANGQASGEIRMSKSEIQNSPRDESVRLADKSELAKGRNDPNGRQLPAAVLDGLGRGERIPSGKRFS